MILLNLLILKRNNVIIANGHYSLERKCEIHVHKFLLSLGKKLNLNVRDT